MGFWDVLASPFKAVASVVGKGVNAVGSVIGKGISAVSGAFNHTVSAATSVANINSILEYKSQSFRNYINEEYIRSLMVIRGKQINFSLAESFEVIRLIF